MASYTCENCGVTFAPTREFIKNPPRFCSDKCRSNWHNDKNRGYTKELENTIKKVQELPIEIKNLKCPHCDTSYITSEGIQSNMLELISPNKFLCNGCSKVSEITLK